MEMEESSRRPPFDRSRDLTAVKKPRLTAPEDPRRPAIGSGTARYRAVEPAVAATTSTSLNEETPSVRGALQQHQELVNQYRTALAELTFNSKPIITNLTIIAGENLQAARAIAATICSHILEVPSEQKLPSLYLLDSIVKNIGRDYIKYFAARLPEVFCKAYKQVEPSIHSGMRHLFGTWKGVFLPQQLQIIEKELGFTAAINGSSSASATSKPDAQSQRQSHSIHVNPKYLEARQRQQTSRPKGVDIVGDVGPSEDVGRPDTYMKMHNMRPQREILRAPSLQKQGGTTSGGYDITSGLKRPLSTSVGKPGDRMVGQGYAKRWLGATGEVEESVSDQRNGYDAKRGILNYTGTRSASGNIPSTQNALRSSADISRSWKNSEEEEYMWDDLGSRAMISGAALVRSRDFCSDDVEKVEFNSQPAKRRPQDEIRSSCEREYSADVGSSEQKEHAPFGRPRAGSPSFPVPGPSPVRHPSVGVPATAVSTAPVGQRFSSPGQSTLQYRPPSPSLSRRDPRQSLVEKSQSMGRLDPRVPASAQSTVGLRRQSLQPANVQKVQGQALKKTSSVAPYVPSSEKLSSPEAELSGIVQKAQQLLSSSSLKRDASSGSSNPVLADPQGQSNVSSLLAAVMKSGLLSGSSVSGQIGSQLSVTAPLISKGVATSSSLQDSVTPAVSRRKTVKPQIPAALATSLSPVSSTLSQASNQTSADPNALSILSTLISKGLISATKTEAAVLDPVQGEGKVPAVPENCAAPPASGSSALTIGNKAEISVQSTKAEVEDLIGYEFRPPVLREFHPAVVDRLSDNLPQKCIACGVSFKLQETLARHSEWHAFKNSIPNCLSRPVRKWYSSTGDWVAGKTGFPFGYNSTCLSVGSSSTGEDSEKMVPADESQCVCLLCGEVFQDFYSKERTEWMFKGAVYMSSTPGGSKSEPSIECGMQNFIVHVDCVSKDSVRDLGLVSAIKKEKDS